MGDEELARAKGYLVGSFPLRMDTNGALAGLLLGIEQYGLGLDFPARYRQAIEAKWLEPSEANVRNFVCAALRATRAGGRVGAIFVAIVQRRLWHHITQEQEDTALRVLRNYRDKHPKSFSLAGRPTSAQSTGDNRILQFVEHVLHGQKPVRNCEFLDSR